LPLLAVLTAGQFTKFQALRQANMQKMMEQRKAATPRAQ
jgi:hypothetical protein